ncbi:MAG: Gfo/Idh/MocA family oxidoreductase [Syntrophaceae bacterium]|nr:Gfo/Idh/MocA family oxidoreductase [Syntrophaceae bacterium]
MKKKKIKVGVVGIGHLGNYHLQKYQKLESCEIVAVADNFPDRAQKAAETYKCSAFADCCGMIGKVDAVSIAVPTSDHYKIAKEFLQAGVDVLIEKPICLTLKEADELIKIAEKKKLVLQVGFVERFNPAIMALEKVIQKPLFIESHRLHPFFERGTDVDVILDLMIHDLDIIVKFVNSPVIAVDAVGVPVLCDKIDIANARISFACGCTANITASRISAKTMQKIRFFSPEGYHSVDCQKREVISLVKGRNEAGQLQIMQNNLEVGIHDPLEEEISSFVNAVFSRSKPVVSGEEARKSLALAVEILRKIKIAEDMLK